LRTVIFNWHRFGDDIEIMSILTYLGRGTLVKRYFDKWHFTSFLYH